MLSAASKGANSTAVLAAFDILRNSLAVFKYYGLPDRLASAAVALLRGLYNFRLAIHPAIRITEGLRLFSLVCPLRCLGHLLFVVLAEVAANGGAEVVAAYAADYRAQDLSGCAAHRLAEVASSNRSGDAANQATQCAELP